MNVRSGVIHRWEDRDRLTTQNEYITNGVSLGLGLRPRGTSWSVESGYLIEWSQADFGDPGKSRSNRQELGVQILLAY